MTMCETYLTSYCNRHHRVRDGKPVEHECSILPPKAIRAERDGFYEDAIDIITKAKPLRTMRRGVRA